MSRRAKIYDLATDRARGRARREIVAAVGALVVLFNILVAALLGASAQAAGSAMLADLSGDGIVICTGASMIVVGHDGKPVEDEGGAVHKALCPFCLPLKQGHAKAPDPADVARPRAPRRVVSAREGQVVVPPIAQFSWAARPRAPPSVCSSIAGDATLSGRLPRPPEERRVTPAPAFG
jgi:hypothetical protein